MWYVSVIREALSLAEPGRILDVIIPSTPKREQHIFQEIEQLYRHILLRLGART